MSPLAQWRVVPPLAMIPVCRCRFSKLLAAKVLRTLGAAMRSTTAVGTRLASGFHEDFNTRVLPLGRRCRVAEAGPMAWLAHTEADALPQTAGVLAHCELTAVQADD